VLTFADVEVDITRRIVSRHGEELKLTRAEYNLLTYFLQNPDRALSRDMILNSVWDTNRSPTRGRWTRMWSGCGRNWNLMRAARGTS